ncbi:unnamed protein product [Rotaria sp. Silwood1]|nr:unnamed protein product [Rotaria sp. Silwood1]
MTDYQESAISDPRNSLQNFSNRQESSFQYGDPPKYEINNISKSNKETTDKNQQLTPFEDDSYDVDEVRIYDLDFNL